MPSDLHERLVDESRMISRKLRLAIELEVTRTLADAVKFTPSGSVTITATFGVRLPAAAAHQRSITPLAEQHV